MPIKKLDVLFAVGLLMVVAGVLGGLMTKDVVVFIGGAIIGGVFMAFAAIGP